MVSLAGGGHRRLEPERREEDIEMAGKQRANPDLYTAGGRAYAEIVRLAALRGMPIRDLLRQIWLSRTTMYSWLAGTANPNCTQLAKLHAEGADVIFILTGKR